MTELKQLKRKIKSFLSNVDKSNFYKSYDEALLILKSFRGKNLSKPDVIKAMNELDNEWEMSEYQEEVFLEISKRLEGFASYNDNIDWW